MKAEHVHKNIKLQYLLLVLFCGPTIQICVSYDDHAEWPLLANTLLCDKNSVAITNKPAGRRDGEVGGVIFNWQVKSQKHHLKRQARWQGKHKPTDSQLQAIPSQRLWSWQYCYVLSCSSRSLVSTIAITKSTYELFWHTCKNIAWYFNIEHFTLFCT